MPNWCQNKLSIEISNEQLNNVHHLIVNDNNAVDFEVLLPIPKELYGVAQFSMISKKPFLVNTNPDSVGYERIKNVPSLKILMEDNEITKDWKIDINDTVFANFHKIVDALAPDLWKGMAVWRLLGEWQARVPPALGTIIRCLQDDHALWCIDRFGADTPRSFATSNWGVKGNAETGTHHKREANNPSESMGMLNYNFATAWHAPTYWFTKLVQEIHEADPTAQVKLEYAEAGSRIGGVRENDDAGEVMIRGMTDEEIDIFLFGK